MLLGSVLQTAGSSGVILPLRGTEQPLNTEASPGWPYRRIHLRSRKFIFLDNPVTARLHASSQRALTATHREAIKTATPWFSAWTACRPGMFLWYRLGSWLSPVGFWAITLVFFKWSLPRGITWLLIDTKWFTVLLTEFWLPFNFKEGLWINKPSQRIDLFGPHLL